MTNSLSVKKSARTIFNAHEKAVKNDDESGPAIDDRLANIIKTFVGNGLQSDIRKERVDLYKKQKMRNYCKLPGLTPRCGINVSSRTTIKDTMLKKALETLSASIIPVVKMVDATTKSLENKDDMPTKAEMCSALTDAVMLSVDSLHELSMFWRELFKPELDMKYKSLCLAKHAVGEELFKDNVTWNKVTSKSHF